MSSQVKLATLTLMMTTDQMHLSISSQVLKTDQRHFQPMMMGQWALQQLHLQALVQQLGEQLLTTLV